MHEGFVLLDAKSQPNTEGGAAVQRGYRARGYCGCTLTVK